MSAVMKPPEPPEGPETLTMPIPREKEIVDISDKGSPDEWLIGLTEQQAIDTLEHHGWSLRVVRRCGQPCIVTRDLRLTRYNVNIAADGTVDEVFGRG